LDRLAKKTAVAPASPVEVTGDDDDGILDGTAAKKVVTAESDAVPATPEPHSIEKSATGDEAVIDPASIRPEEFVCFGTIDPNHSECKACQFRTQCAAKAGK